MPLVEFSEMPDHARLWVFPGTRKLEDAQSQELLSAVDGFLAQWSAHGAPLVVAREWRHGRFLLVAVDESATGVSGCSIDGLVRHLRELERRFDLRLTDHAPVWYRDNGTISMSSRAEFAAMARVGAVGPETPVFDNSVTTVGAVGLGRWELPARDSWHASLLGP